MARGDQVVDGEARGQRLAGQLVVFQHGAALQQPVFSELPLQVAEQAPDVIAQCAVEIGFRVCLVIAITHAAEQAQVVGQAQGVLQFEVVTGFAHALVDVAAYGACRAAEQLRANGGGQRLLLGCSRRHGAERVLGECHHVKRIEIPQLAQGRTEGDFRLAGAPDLLALPVLRRALQIEAVLGAEVDGPAQRTGVVAGADVRTVVARFDAAKYRGVAVGTLVAAFLGRQLPVEAVLAVELLAGDKVEAVQAAAVAVVTVELIVVEAIVLLPGQRQAHCAVLPARAVAGVPVTDSTLPLAGFQACASAVGRLAGEDIDHAHQGIGAVTDGIRPAKHFDALDVLDGYGNVRPVHRRQAGAIDRAAVEQYLQAACLGDIGAVVVGGGLVAVPVANHHAGYQAQQFGDVAGATGLDQGAIEYRDAAGNGSRRLFQACRGEYLGHGLVGAEQVVAGCLAGSQQCQQGQEEWGAGAGNHATALFALKVLHVNRAARLCQSDAPA
ncbi:hypothetical protein D9M68_544230 [compost metagenome]